MVEEVVVRPYPVISGVPQSLILERVLFNVIISDNDCVIEWTLSKFAAETKLSGAADMLKIGLSSGSRWAVWCSTMPSARSCASVVATPTISTSWGHERIEHNPIGRDLWVTGGWKARHEPAECPHNPKSQQYPGLSKEVWPASRGRWSCSSASVSPHLGNCVQV